MGLPFSRDYTQSSAAQIKASLLNNLQDQIVRGGHNAVNRWIALTVPLVANFGGTLGFNTDGTFTFSASGVFKAMAAGDWQEGDRILGFQVRYLGDATTISPAFGLYAVNGANALTTLLGTITIVNPPASWANYAVTLGSPHVMAAGEALILNVDAISKSPHKLGPIAIQNDR